MGDGEGSDPMSRAPIIITPPGRIPGTPILMSRPRHRQEGGPPCDFTGLPVRLDYPRGSRGLEWAGRERDVRPRPRTTYRTRSPAASTDVQTPNLHSGNALASAVRGPRTRSGRPCRPSTRLNPAMEHTDSIERDSEYLERRRRCALVRELPQPDRVLLEWRVVDGWDYAEIALRLGVPRADLVKRVQRIRTDLRRKEKALGVGETKLAIAAFVTVRDDRR